MWSYPSWDVPYVGGGMVVATIATLHVLAAHFTVGAGMILPVGEYWARKSESRILLDFLKLFSKTVLLVGFVFGAITGVGIWFSISIVATRATSTLIHTFVWFWAIEWVFFLVEIVCGYAYYATWDRLDAKSHNRIGWIYAFSSWMSLVVISGILSFMLSPGNWIETRNVWDGFFNPTFLPTVALRTLSSLGIASLAAMALANLPRIWTREERTRIINFAAQFLWPFVLMLPCAFWYFSGIPAEAKDLLGGGAAAMMLFFLFGIAASTLVGIYAYFGLIRARRYINWETSMLLLSIAIIATVSMEFVREGIRKPYLIYDYQYSNGFLKEETAKINQSGVLAVAPWRRLGVGDHEVSENRLGKTMYDVQCAGCHVEKGFNDVAPLVKGWSRELIAFNLERLDELKHFMPPVVGTEDERRALVEYLWKLNGEAEGS